MNVAGDQFEELRELCIAAGDKASLAIGMAELVIDHAFHDRIREAAELASAVMALTESLGDPNLTVGLCVPVIYAKTESAEHSDLLRWTERVIDLADDDPSKGDLLIGCPLAYALTMRASPVMALVVPDGETTCGTARRWAAVSTRCPTPRSSASASSGEYRTAC